MSKLSCALASGSAVPTAASAEASGRTRRSKSVAQGWFWPTVPAAKTA